MKERTTNKEAPRDDVAAPDTDEQNGTPGWVVLVDAHLRRAAALAIEHGVTSDGFVRACGIVYEESDPEMQLRARIEELRQHGQVGQA